MVGWLLIVCLLVVWLVGYLFWSFVAVVVVVAAGGVVRCTLKTKNGFLDEWLYCLSS